MKGTWKLLSRGPPNQIKRSPQPLDSYLCTVFCLIVLYPGKGVCADPVNEGAILGRGGPSPHSRDRERQLAPDIGRGET
jgi:hypothetical protein